MYVAVAIQLVYTCVHLSSVCSTHYYVQTHATHIQWNLIKYIPFLHVLEVFYSNLTRVAGLVSSCFCTKDNTSPNCLLHDFPSDYTASVSILTLE